MRQGLLPENIYLRAVDKKIRTYNNRIIKGAVTQSDCAFLSISEGEIDQNETLWKAEISMSVEQALLKAAAVAGKPALLQAQLLLPIDFEENRLRLFVQTFTEVVEPFRLKIDDFTVRSAAGVNSIFLNIELCGIAQKAPKQLANKQIIYVGSAGAAGCSILANRHEALLRSRYTSDYIHRMKQVYDCERMRDKYSLISTEQSYELYSVGEGGIFGALWTLGGHKKSGLKVFLKSIPIYQETIELCDFFDINPYMLYSAGDFLVLTDDADAYVSKCEKLGIMASHIGCLTENNDRVIINNDEERFLTAPQMDELFRAAV